MSDTGTFLPGTQNTGTMTAIGERPRRRGLVLILVLVALLLAAVGYGAYQVLKDDTPPPPTQVRVPSVIGSNRASAESQLINANLKVGKVNEVNGPDETKGQVIEQNPKATQLVDEGTAVNITINLGVKTGKIPSGLAGKSEAEAKTALEAAGFTTRTETAPVNSDSLAQQPGKVVNTDPAEGADYADGAEVVIYLSPTEAPVPNLSGMTEDEAKNAAKSAGFPNIAVRTKTTTDDSQVDKVIEQNPSDGQTLGRDQNVTVTIGTKKETITVPQVLGLQLAGAQVRLGDAGFTNVHVKETVTDTATEGTVVGVDPGEGTEAKPNAKITLEVAKAPPSESPTTTDTGSASPDPGASSQSPTP